MRLKKLKIYKDKRINIKLSEDDLNKIKRKALLYTEGNISELVLYAALNFVPDKDDFENEKGRTKRPRKKAEINNRPIRA